MPSGVFPQGNQSRRTPLDQSDIGIDDTSVSVTLGISLVALNIESSL